MQRPNASSLVERYGSTKPFTRRGVLIRGALIAASVSVAPWNVLRSHAHPGSTCDDGGCGCPCHTGGTNCGHTKKCCKQVYTAFCCQLPGGNNGCPDDTEIGGYWKCNDYEGTQICDNTPGMSDVRWYLDCNLLPGGSCSNGCHCLDNDCDNWRVCCNYFKYGQCHTEHGYSCIKCRIVRCQAPWNQYPAFCDPPAGAAPEDPTTCGHDPACLPDN